MNPVEELLAEGLQACRARESSAFDHETSGTQGIVLLGAGGLGRKLLAQLRSAGTEPLAFTDNNRAIWGTTLEGLPVLAPAAAARRYGSTAAFVVGIWASWADRMVDQMESLQRLGCRKVIPFQLLLWKYPGLLPHVQIDLPSRVHQQAADVARGYEVWADDASRAEYVAQLRWRLLADFQNLRPAVPDEYWPKDLLTLPPDPVFVDAGAFDGDTLEQFIGFTGGRFSAIHAFEPDAENFAKLTQRVAGLPADQRTRIQAVQAAVGNRQGTISFSSGKGAGSRIDGDSTQSCALVRLDQAVPGPVSYIKYDIEGAEPDALEGSRDLLDRYCPGLAVCVYHTQDHLWTLPLLIRSLNPRYRLYLRPHGQIWETVCYALK